MTGGKLLATRSVREGIRDPCDSGVFLFSERVPGFRSVSVSLDFGFRDSRTFVALDVEKIVLSYTGETTYRVLGHRGPFPTPPFSLLGRTPIRGQPVGTVEVLNG